MSEQDTFFTRIGNWFRKPKSDLTMDDEPGNGLQTRTSILRPWAKRDQAIANLQSGFQNLNDLMGAIRDNLERSADRQDQLLHHLSHLPGTLQATVEANRTQTETLKAIYQQMEHQKDQQQQLAQSLEKLGDGSGTQRELLTEVRDRIDVIQQQDERISDALSSVGAAMQSVSRTTESTTSVLSQMRDNVDARDGELERILLKQNTRFTTLLMIAIFLSIAAIAAVGVVGWMLLDRGVVR
jgi:methyl-accepting chemotaxis protein